MRSGAEFCPGAKRYQEDTEMKKLFALMLAVLLLASVLTGCAQKTAEADKNLCYNPLV